MNKLAEKINIILLCIGTVTLIGLQIKFLGWFLLLLGFITLLFCRRQFSKDVLLIYISIGILGITQINTDISYSHMLQMGVELAAAVGIPYFVSRFIYKDYLVRFKFHHGRGWYKLEIAYIGLAILASYFLFPFYLKSTGAYLNWTVEPGASNIIRFFIGTNALGIWDELFFVSTVLGILRKYLNFHFANLAQAVLFTSFLYELGFTGWGPLIIYPFALSQGYIFKKTESLFYIITIHLSIDLILFLSLINAHHPNWISIFVIR